jgi:nitronate monooxygenase
MTLSTRLTQRLGIAHPVLSAPMDQIAGGRLAGAVTAAGGLGFIGGGYADDDDWLPQQLLAAGNRAVGCGFITWALRQHPHLLDVALSHKPKALFLSFDDPEPFAGKIKAAGTTLVCQVQRRSDAMRAIDVGADILVAQGSEAGGHGGARGLSTLVPEIADLAAQRAPDTLVCAGGGITDGRGLAAALMLGADGVLVGTRFWAASEADVHPKLHAAALVATGDDTVRQSVLDIVRGRPWPARYTGRVLKNEMVGEWLGREDALRSDREAQAARYEEAAQRVDPRIAAVIVGEGIGFIDRIEPAAVILERMVSQAEALLARAPRYVVS